MTIIRIFEDLFRKKLWLSGALKSNKLKVLNFNPIIFITIVISIFIIFFSINTFVDHRNIENKDNIKTITGSKEFSNFTDFIISKLNSPYFEIKYQIKNNDSIEKILKKYQVRSEDIKDISTKLKRRKLSNIYSGRELSLILKKLSDGSNTVVNLNFPISNTSSIEVRHAESFYS